jgi:hypothetical protein
VNRWADRPAIHGTQARSQEIVTRLVRSFRPASTKRGEVRIVLLAAQAAASHGSQGISAAQAAIIGAVIAAGTTLATIGLNFFIQRRLAARSERTENVRFRVDQITQQLSRLYGPLLLLTAQSKALAERLRDGRANPDQWHLLDNLEAVAGDPTDRAIAEQIIEVNQRIEGLILARAGLIRDGDIPDSFVSYLGHYRFLRIAFDAAKAGAGASREITAKRFEYFPPAFDGDVTTAYKALVAERNRLVSEGPAK